MFRVEWTNVAADQLAIEWTRAADRNAVSAASYALDHRALADNPENQGESREPGRRVMFAPPLGVRYRVDAATRLVSVVACWAFRTR